ncbi:unnamed protein product [Somion occarium]|uniref:Pseudouridine synthase I TruA alpha/beta domain-containing protein n=1 Tax=Somion occarium TaxID=3059160 RepID=A0ABP1E6R8_9APHY
MFHHLLWRRILNPLSLHQLRQPIRLSQWFTRSLTIDHYPFALMQSDQSEPTLKRSQAEMLEDGASEPKRVKVSEESSAEQHRTSPVEQNLQEVNAATQGESSRASSERPQSKKQKKLEKRSDRRSRRRATLRPDGEEHAESLEPKAPRLPKRQCALLIGYSGAGYNGMQMQYDTNVKTIEGTLFNALVKAGAVSQDNADDPVKVNLGRAARTDAGVHAAGNLISMKIITQVPDVPDLVARINEELPPEIRLWNFLRVQNSFNARGVCDSRKYTYFFPSYLLIPPKPGSGLHKIILNQAPEGYEQQAHPFWVDISPESSPDDDMRRKRLWRVSQDVVEKLREVANKFVGSHNFHNFTVGASPKDASSRRVIREIEIADPVVYGDTEWIAVLLHGQSFMFHQRKMIAALILIARTGTPAEVISELYGIRQLFIPRMPALGLLLEYPLFNSYNKKTEPLRENKTPEDPEYRPTIDFEVHRAEIDKFKQEFIYSGMRAVEDRDGIFDAWIRTIDSYMGVKRPNPFRERKRFDATSFPEGSRERISDAADLGDAEADDELKLDKKKLAELEG